MVDPRRVGTDWRRGANCMVTETRHWQAESAVHGRGRRGGTETTFTETKLWQKSSLRAIIATRNIK
jgi:hypothetical protein